MIRIAGALLTVMALVWLVEPAAARPDYLARFQQDPMRLPSVDGCSVCHDNPEGGGPRNEFGSAFESAGHQITPVMRASFPDRFGFVSTRLPDGSVFSFSDPENNFVVVEREENKYTIDMAEVTATTDEDRVPPPGNAMSFFITSEGMGEGAHLKGLAGADQHCQSLAEAVGAGEKTWRAYLSTSFMGEPAVNAGDRIGPGPWYNANGIMIARGVVDLHKENRISKENALNEKGEMVNGRGDDPNQHDILTGTLADGTAAVDMNCNNWTTSGEGSAMVGHHDRQGGGDNGSSWNAAHPSRGCGQEALESSGGAGLFYCFATN